MKEFSLGEIKKTVLNIKKQLQYNDNVTIKFIVIDEEYVEVLIAIKNVDYEVIKIDFIGLFDLYSINDWIKFKISDRLNIMLKNYIIK